MNHSLLLIMLITLFGSGCVSNPTLTQPQIDQLSTVSVSGPSVSGDAYMQPEGSSGSSDYANSVPMATGGGLIPALIGSLIDSAIASKEQSAFEVTNKRYFAAAEENMPKHLDKIVEAAVRNSVQDDPFFGPRLKEQSKNHFETNIRNYGLRKSRVLGGTAHLEFQLMATVTLFHANRDEVLARRIIANSNMDHPLKDYANDKTLVEQSAQSAAKNLGLQLRHYLKTVETPATE